jgi:hypothetical protein
LNAGSTEARVSVFKETESRKMNPAAVRQKKGRQEYEQWRCGVPTATPAAMLDSIEVRALSSDEQLTFSALQSWTTIDVVKGNTSDLTDVDLEPVKARFVKIIVTDAGDDSTARISEVEVFGKKS